MLKLPESAGMYLSFAGLTPEELRKAGGAGAKLLDEYKNKYGKDPEGGYPMYGVAAMQVILAAIEKSDGTRKGVTEAVLSGDGHHHPGRRLGHRQGDQDRSSHRGHCRKEPQHPASQGRQGNFRQAAVGRVNSRRARALPGPAVLFYAAFLSVCSE